MIEHTNEVRLLVEEVVDEAYFLNKISSFEVQYEMSWGDFLGKWRSEENHDKMCQGDSFKYADFCEWAFLCNNLLPTLLTKDSEYPPLRNCDEPSQQKPDTISGFWFFGSQFDRPVAL